MESIGFSERSMSTFDLHQLRIFVTVIDAGSLTAGAPRVFLSQSAASEQLRKLEERCGHVLLYRGKAGVRPTPAGERLLAHARRLLALSEEAWRDLSGEALAGELRLGVTDYFRPAELTGMLARLGERYPQLRLRVRIGKSADIEQAYARGDIDIGLSMRLVGAASGGTGSTGKRTPRHLRRESLHWVAAPGTRRVQAEPLRLLALPDTCAFHQYVVQLLKRRSIPFRVVHEASGVAGLQSALAAGLGIACLNASSMSADVVDLMTPHGLPKLPAANFHLLCSERGEQALVPRVADVLAEYFAA
jgi:DNA-binding transcriptional LysR family regulator